MTTHLRVVLMTGQVREYVDCEAAAGEHALVVRRADGQVVEMIRRDLWHHVEREVREEARQ